MLLPEFDGNHFRNRLILLDTVLKGIVLKRCPTVASLLLPAAGQASKSLEIGIGQAGERG